MKERLRILRISHSATMSVYRERERALSLDSDLDVALICPSDWSHLGGKNEPISESFPTVRAGTFLTGSIPLFSYAPLPLILMLKQFKPDIVDVHEEPYSVSCFESLLLTRKYAPKAAVVFYSAQNINKRYPYPFRWAERYVYQHSQGAYPCSTGVREVLRQKGFDRHCPVIPLGVDMSTFSPDGPAIAIRQPGKRQFIMGFTGRIEPYKGLQMLIECLPLLQPMLGDRQVLLAVAGAGSQTSELQNLAHKLGISESVRWLGELKASEMPAFYRACDVIVVPSLTTTTWKEQFGRVPVEAMSCGVPAVVSNSGSLPEVMSNVGIIADEHDPRSWLQALYALAIDEPEYAEISKRGIELVRERYTWSRVAAAMKDLYQQAIATKNAVPHQKLFALR